MKTFTPHLFISVGETGAMFTLRETHPHYIAGEGDYGNAVVNGVYQGRIEVRDHHVKNLGQDPDEAFQKAQEYAKECGLELKSNRATLDRELRKIGRATKEEMEARRQKELEAWFNRRALEIINRQVFLNKCQKSINDGVMPVGKYSGSLISKLPRGYLAWIAEAEFEEKSPMRLIKTYLFNQRLVTPLPTPDKTSTVGEPKQRLDFDVTVVKSIDFDTRFGLCTVTTMVDSNKNCLVVFSSSFAPEVGEELKIKATVKEHSEYNGQAQTIVSRVKIIGD